jgi:hypothetical protein
VALPVWLQVVRCLALLWLEVFGPPVESLGLVRLVESLQPAESLVESAQLAESLDLLRLVESAQLAESLDLLRLVYRLWVQPPLSGQLA